MYTKLLILVKKRGGGQKGRTGRTGVPDHVDPEKSVINAGMLTLDMICTAG